MNLNLYIFILTDSKHEWWTQRERFKQRKKHASKVCKQKGWTGLDQWLVEEGVRRRPNILYIDQLKMIYCVIPKVMLRPTPTGYHRHFRPTWRLVYTVDCFQTGCTNWKKIMLYLTGKWDEETVAGIQKGNWNMADSKKANDPAQLEHMNFWHLNKTERLKRLDNFTKFMVVRGIFIKLPKITQSL